MNTIQRTQISSANHWHGQHMPLGFHSLVWFCPFLHSVCRENKRSFCVFEAVPEKPSVVSFLPSKPTVYGQIKSWFLFVYLYSFLLFWFYLIGFKFTHPPTPPLPKGIDLVADMLVVLFPSEKIFHIAKTTINLGTLVAAQLVSRAVFPSGMYNVCWKGEV